MKRHNVVFCILEFVDSFIHLNFLKVFFAVESRLYYCFPAKYFIGKRFLLNVQDPSTFPPPAFASVHTPFVCIWCVIFRHRPALWHMLLTVSLSLETAALVTLRHSVFHTDTHIHAFAFFFNLGEQQLISHCCATPPITAPLAPCGARRQKRRVFRSTP